MARIILLTLCCLAIGTGCLAQRCGVTDTIALDAFGSSRVTIPIEGYLNDDLADPGQGLCNVSAYFSHSYVYGLSITLVSPAGDSLRLIGPGTDQTRPPSTLARWFVDFPSCAGPAAPDPGAPERWDNTEDYNWPAFGTFRGAYLPNGGCLEELARGPVNGDWQLVVENNRADEQGGLSFLLLEFCDPLHEDGPCCSANAGDLPPAEPLIACAQPVTLPVNLPPRYRIPRPDPTEYGYAYTIDDGSGIQWLQDEPNLAGFPAGTYQICGLSYRLGELAAIPTDGSLTSAQLSSNLQGSTPVACADLTPDCQTVVLLPPPAPTDVSRQLCRGGLYQVGSNIFSESGNYLVNLPGAFGCDSVVNLTLDVVDTLFVTADTTICAEAAYALGDELLTASGTYRDTLTSFYGCDSIVTLNLTVADPIVFSEEVTICGTDFYELGDTILTTSGIYRRTVTAANGCDSTVSVDLLVLDPAVAYRPFRPQLDCLGDTVLLNASESDLTFADDFGWYDGEGDLLRAALDYVARTPGRYVFRLTAAARGVACTVTDTVIITDERFLPEVELTYSGGNGDSDPVPLNCDSSGNCATINCRYPELRVRSTVLPAGNVYEYDWASDSPIEGPADSALVVLTRGGTYNLRVTDSATGCTLDTSVVTRVDREAPLASIEGDSLLNCLITEVTLTADTNQARTGELSFAWSGGCLPAPVSGPRLAVDCPGEYTLRVTNLTNGCFQEATHDVVQDVAPVLLNLAPAASPISCLEPGQTLQPGAITAANPVRYRWSNGTDSLSDDRELRVTEADAYTLTVIDRVNGCSAFANVVVAADTSVPAVPVGPLDLTLNCYDSTATLGLPPPADAPDFRYAWRDLNTTAPALSTRPTLDVETPGSVYERTVTDAGNGCTAVDTIRVSVDLNRPVVRLTQPVDFDCFIDTVLVSPVNLEFTYPALHEWAGPCVSEPDSGGPQAVFCPGDYAYTLTNESNGCATTREVTVGLASTGVVAVLEDSVFLDCDTGQAVLDRSRGSDAAFVRWFRDGVRVRLFGQAPVVTVPGHYQLVLTNFNESCTDTAFIEVLADCPALSIIVPPDSLTCNNQSVTLDAGFSLPDTSTSIAWLPPEGAVARPGDTPRELVVYSPGRYGFTIRNNIGGEVDTAFVQVNRNQRSPTAEAGPRDTISCDVPAVTLSGAGSSEGELYAYVWVNTNDDTLGFDIKQEVEQAGTYLLSVTQTETGCNRVDVVTIIDDTDLPTLYVYDTLIPCDALDHTIRARSDDSITLRYQWTDVETGDTSGGDTLVVTAPGQYVARAIRADNGCSAAVVADVGQAPCPPFPELLDTVVTCLVGSVRLRPTFRDGCDECTFRWRRNGQLLADAQAESLVVTRPGAYSLTATNRYGLSSTAEADVRDRRTPPNATAGPDRSLTCTRSSVTLSGLVPDPGFTYTYAWSDAAGATIEGADTPALEATVAGRYALSVTNEQTGCTVVDAVEVTIDTVPPLAEAGESLLLTCADKRRVLDATASARGRQYGYRWTGGAAGTCIEGDTTLNPVMRCPGRYQIEVTDRRNGCIATDTVSVLNDNELPRIVPIADTTLDCLYRSIELTGGDTSDADVAFIWTLAGSEDPLPESAPATISVAAAGAYRFQLTNTRTGCENEFTVDVGANLTEPEVEAGPADTFRCSLDSLQLMGEVMANDASDLQFSWRSRTGFLIDDATTLTPTVFQADEYYLTVLNPRNRCSATDSVTLSRDAAAPEVDAGPDLFITCARTQVRAMGVISTVSGGGVITWTDPAGEAAGLLGIETPEISTPGTFQLNVLDPRSGCSGADILEVLPDTLPPVATIDRPDGNVLNCYTPEVRLVATLSSGEGPLTYTWRREAFRLGDSSEFSAGVPGGYSLTVAQTGNGCTAVDSITLFADLKPPVVAIQAPDALTCLEDSVLLSAAASEVGVNYVWLDSNDRALGTGTSVWVDEGGRAALTALRERNGCRDTADVIVPVDRTPPNIRLATPQPLNCERTTVLLSGTGSDRGGDYRATWTDPQGEVFPAAEAYSYEAERAGAYLFTLTNLGSGCVSVDSLRVVLDATAIEGLAYEAVGPSCPEVNTGEVFIMGVEGGRGPFRYGIDGGALTDRLTYDGLPLGSYDIEVVGADGCSLVETFDLRRSDPNTLDAGGDTIVRLGDSLTLSFTTNFNSTAEVYWRRDGFTYPDSLLVGGTLTVRPNVSGSYELTVVGEDGCVARDAVFVEVDERIDFFVPTAFSPNGDGRNDLLRPFPGRQVTEVIAFEVYDRWGSQLYRTTATDDLLAGDWGWGGQVNGRAVTPQVVVWRFAFRTVDGRTLERRGEAILLR